MTAIESPEDVVDYAGFDFARLWAGRDKVSAVERAIVTRALDSCDRRRILEVGTGFGRLLGTLTQLSREVVATDLDAETLEKVAVDDDSGRVVRVASNLYHLPFVDGAFTAATLVRVHHHLLQPVTALREVARVLQGGATLVVSYQPRPSVGTLVKDLQRALRPSGTEPFESVTFARGAVVLRTSPFPIRAAARDEFAREVRAAGLVRRAEMGSGFEEYAPLRRWPAERFLRVGTALGGAPAFPTRFAVIVKPSASIPALPRLSEILACPQCRTPQPGWTSGRSLECGGCSFVGGRRGRVLDLRYIPADARRWEVAT